MLPAVSDEQLLAELAVVVSTGWALPTRPHRAAEVRHLLGLVDLAATASFESRARRLMGMLDEALRADVRVGRDLRTLTEEEARGLRILFGTHPDYRTEPSPLVRREEASEYLVPAWQTHPPSDRAGTFQRRHQPRVLGIALEHLRARYGQQDRLSLTQSYDVISQRRWWQVDERRQIAKAGESVLARSRIDHLAIVGFVEPRHLLELGAVDAKFQLRPHPLGTRVEVDSIRDHETEPKQQIIRLVLLDPCQTGDLLGWEWEQHITYGPDVTRWDDYYVATQNGTDGYDLELAVTFTDYPSIVWHFSSSAFEDETRLEPNDASRLEIDGTGTARQHWPHAERRQDYGIKWRWV